MGRPLQWIICLLHFNELPFRHLFSRVDGHTSGPRAYCGIIGQNLKGCENLPVICFQAIDCEFPGIDPSILSKDKKNLLRIASAIKIGVVPEDLLKSEPGALNLSRWLTTANRILRLYVSTRQLSAHLKLLVNFILKVYAPSWFRIKGEHSVKYGARHVWQFIQSPRYLAKKYRSIIDKVIFK